MVFKEEYAVTGHRVDNSCFRGELGEKHVGESSRVKRTCPCSTNIVIGIVILGIVLGAIVAALVVLAVNVNQDSTESTMGSGTSQTSASTSSGSCDCTGSSIRPQGSENTCTTFPCLIFEDEFNTLNLDVWEHEINLGGGGNWEFQQYTNNRSNSYVRDGKLFIKPLLFYDRKNEIERCLALRVIDGGESRGGSRWSFDGNARCMGAGKWTSEMFCTVGSQPGDVCTGNAFYGCRRVGSSAYILNPIQSARLRSSRGFNFKYGMVEVRAKMPKGDWLWPAIWMSPLRNAYGKWPASGEIDIVESRGNANYTDENGNEKGVRNAGSALHFGSDAWHHKWDAAYGERLSPNGSYADDFHKYVFIWDEDHISISIDDEEVVNVTPQTSMWEYSGNDQDGVENPWVTGNKMAPFDQEFYFILNVAVGGVEFFPDRFISPTGKPWSDASPHGPAEFWAGRNKWLPTWHLDQNNGEGAAMQVDYIKVWKLKP